MFHQNFCHLQLNDLQSIQLKMTEDPSKHVL